ncbi:MAG TPA: DUF1853 family protein [Burkholderiaceae bacterium]|jgi:hypothetical protein
MPPALNQLTESFQAQFHRRWNHLSNPHVRALAWLLDSPDLLDVHASQWSGKIGTLVDRNVSATHDWLAALDRDPTQLQAAIDKERPTYRLGYYAERLMTFYFQQQGTLIAHSVQVQSSDNGTVGEFDFLLRDHDGLVHWEFATKFYLLASDETGSTSKCLVGPNLADTLNAKMHKILEQQLLLAQHPAAQIHLPQPVTFAQALVKGWLFYHGPNRDQSAAQIMDGISIAHCRGFWCRVSEWKLGEKKRAIILPRLRWLAPAKLPFVQVPDSESFQQKIRQHFENEDAPLLVAILDRYNDDAIEIDRGFIVSDDWPAKAKEYLDRVSLADSS